MSDIISVISEVLGNRQCIIHELRESASGKGQVYGNSTSKIKNRFAKVSSNKYSASDGHLGQLDRVTIRPTTVLEKYRR